MKFSGISANQMGGVSCIRDLSIPAATVVGMVVDGLSESEILASYSDRDAADIKEALHFAAEAVRERELPLIGSWRS